MPRSIWSVRVLQNRTLYIKEDMNKKIKILTLSDHPLSPSGVGTQTKYMIDALLKTGKYEIISFGGAIKHENYEPMKIAEDWVVIPVDGYGTQESIRSVIRNEKPDILWFMTDPRFYGWLWDIENEIRANLPMVYYHVWDNKPYPVFNRPSYLSNDLIATISKVTDDVVRNVAPEVECVYLPHSVDTDIFKPLAAAEKATFRVENLREEDRDKVIFFWNNRNARRKQTGSIMFWFKEFLDEVGHDKAMLVMHTDPHDPHGQDMYAILDDLRLLDGQISISTGKYPLEGLASLYNMADCTINISDAEGFGLATFESLCCGTPIVVNMTGGLQEQVTDGEEWFGVGINPTSRAIIGSQDVPWIYEDRVAKEDFINALRTIYDMTPKQREGLGLAGRGHVEKNYNFEEYGKKWDELLTKVHETHGSWETRKNYQSWRLIEIP